MIAVLFAACADRRGRGALDAGTDAPSNTDAAPTDGAIDGGRGDAGTGDGGRDVGPSDGGATDSGATDSGNADSSGMDASADSGASDSGIADTGPADTGVADTGTDTRDSGPPLGGCISGSAGTHVARFRWEGTTSGSRAYVVYEANTLPDTSRWRANAASSSIGYSPVFRDPFLGEGGLELSGTVFIDVELSTSGLPPVSQATVAIYGRSFNTTASGSFSWQTFDGTGATPSGSVSNVAPYQWYPGNATAALPAGNSGTLLRIRAGPPSGALIVRRVEICFNAP